jgi:UTP:GlnB (protein PII) uridylyltransferase
MDEPTETMPPDFLVSFRDSMPASYRQQQGAEEIREHAGIVWRRGDGLAHAEIWTKRLNAVVICVVSDDRPGISSLIRATIAAHGLDVSAAQAYCRNNEKDRPEAVHFLWLSPTREGSESGPIGESDIADIAASLRALLRGELDLGTVIDRVSSLPTPPISGIEVSVADVEDDERAILLTVDAGDRPGLLMTITSVLFSHRVTVLSSDLTTSGGRARGRFQMVEVDGSPLTHDRGRAIAGAVKVALEHGNP